LEEVVISFDYKSIEDKSGYLYIDDMFFVDTSKKFVNDSDFDLTDDSADVTSDFLDMVERRTFQYFVDCYDPTTGLFSDRVHFRDLASVAATGFGLTALCIGAERGWIDAQKAEDMAEKTLEFLTNDSIGDEIKSRMADTTQDAIDDPLFYYGVKGWYYHFLDISTDCDIIDKTGHRKNENVELSSVDTALLLAGAITCKQYFSANSDIGNAVDEMYDEIEWDFMLDEREHVWDHSDDEWMDNPNFNRFFNGWLPEWVGEGINDLGFSDPDDEWSYLFGHWDFLTDEVMLIALLAYGADSVNGHPITSTDSFYNLNRFEKSYNAGIANDVDVIGDVTRDIVVAWNASTFQYFFANCWFDLYGLEDQYGLNWWQNSVKAGLSNRDYCIKNEVSGIIGWVQKDGELEPMYGITRSSSSLNKNSWGLTASDGIQHHFNHVYLGGNGGLPHGAAGRDVPVDIYGSTKNNPVIWDESTETIWEEDLVKWQAPATVPPYGGISMIGFASGYKERENAMPLKYIQGLMQNFYQNTQLWTGWYGFRDSYTDADKDPETGEYLMHEIREYDDGVWVDLSTDIKNPFPIYKSSYFGIDQGPMLIMIENYRSGFVWSEFMENTDVQKGVNAVFADPDSNYGYVDDTLNIELDGVKVWEKTEDFAYGGYGIVKDAGEGTKAFSCEGYLEAEDFEINDGTSVTFTAGTGIGAYIKIKSGFRVEVGAEFKASVE